MPRTSQMLTVTVPKAVYKDIRREATRRSTTVSGLIRESFEAFTQGSGEVYSDAELAGFLRRDRLHAKLRSELDILLRSRKS